MGLPTRSELMSLLNVPLSQGNYENEGQFEQEAFNRLSLTVSPWVYLMNAVGCGTHPLSPQHQEMSSSVTKTVRLFVLIPTSGMVNVSLLQGFPDCPSPAEHTEVGPSRSSHKATSSH